jgi:hypothetical protein
MRWILTPATFFTVAVLAVSAATASTLGSVCKPLKGEVFAHKILGFPDKFWLECFARTLNFGLCRHALVIKQQDSQTVGQSTPSPNPVTVRFSDIANDIYAAEIEQAAKLEIIAGLPDKKFHPQDSVTREQIVSMVVESLKKVPLVNSNVPFPDPNPPRLPQIPSKASSKPFRDVDVDLWSAAKIQFARDLGLIGGYKDGTFRPTAPVTRAELVVVLQRADQYITKLRGWDGWGFFGGQDPITFSDTQNNWARDIIKQMSANCRVASPLNEKGTAFAPNTAARRNYTAAAVVRSIQCLSILPPPPS